MKRGGNGLLAGLVLGAVAFVSACGSGGGTLTASVGESCMQCHNASLSGDYSGPGIENPHPFGTANQLNCTTCHGGDPEATTAALAHVPPPPEIGDRAFQATNFFAYFNRLTLTGMDKLPDYVVNGQNYSPLDYLQFVNPGDLRVTSHDRACGQCHGAHSDLVQGSLLATSAGVISGALFAVGDDNRVPANVGQWQDTAADVAFRAVTNPTFSSGTSEIGEVGELIETPVWSGFDDTSPDKIRNNDLYLAAALAAHQQADGQVVADSPLARLYLETTAFQCGDCHLGSSGANNRYGDFRSSGCTACHMPYAASGRSGSSDPNINKTEPLNVDNIDEPERPHLRSHQIVSAARVTQDGTHVAGTQGIDDMACAGCHQGSNRTVMQYWGIRLDQNQDVKNHRQYPADPASFVTTKNDPRLFDPVIKNKTFNGRNFNQYLLFEDYDNDGRDDTPEDVHYEAGLGCIDCHGSHDLHGGDVNAPAENAMLSRMEQAVAIRCESCHGSADSRATIVAGTNKGGEAIQHAVDAEGHALKHVVREDDGHIYLYSKLDGQKHFVPQTLDTIVDSGVLDPIGGDAVYTDNASYAMGRTDGNNGTGFGPLQSGDPHNGFSHLDQMDCATCHSSWTNNCIGCHLEADYTTNANNFSNITGVRSVFEVDNADFVYQSPVPFQLGIGPRGKVSSLAANTDVFWQYNDKGNVDSQIFSFSDRNGAGKDPAVSFGSLSHNAMLAHSIRGRATPTQEGARSCVACHLTTEGLANFGSDYAALRTALGTSDFDSLDFDLLKSHIGQNTGNQLNSPLWVHMVAGLGSGLFLFNQDGGAMNKLDDFAGRVGSKGTSPKDSFVAGNVKLDLDRIVEPTGASNASSNHMSLNGPNALRDGSADPLMAGPLGASMIQRLTDPVLGIVLNAWLGADGDKAGNAQAVIDSQ